MVYSNISQSVLHCLLVLLMYLHESFFLFHTASRLHPEHPPFVGLLVLLCFLQAPVLDWLCCYLQVLWLSVNESKGLMSSCEMLWIWTLFWGHSRPSCVVVTQSRKRCFSFCCLVSQSHISIWVCATGEVSLCWWGKSLWWVTSDVNSISSLGIRLENCKSMASQV